jgi:hypothetical protein
MSDTVYIDDVFDEYFAEIPSTERSNIKIGQIVWTHFSYSNENLEVWRPNSLDESKTYAKLFEISTGARDLFNRNAPLSNPPLKTYEEFLVVRAKKRPAIVISTIPALPKLPQVRHAEKMMQPVYLLAPLYSLYNDDKKAKVHQDLVNRIRRLDYPHIFFIPKEEGSGIKDSFCRFDKICGSFLGHIRPDEICLNKQVHELFFSQLNTYIGGVLQQEFKKAHELLHDI